MVINIIIFKTKYIEKTMSGTSIAFYCQRDPVIHSFQPNHKGLLHVLLRKNTDSVDSKFM